MGEMDVVENKKPKKYVGVVISVVLLSAVIGAIIGVRQYQQKKEAQRLQEYSENFDTAVVAMLWGADEAGSCHSLIDQVWYNSIYKKGSDTTDKYTRPNGEYVADFNEAVDNLFADAEFSARLDGITGNLEAVSTIMENLKDPPEEFMDKSQQLAELCNAYLSLMKIAVVPSGSLNTFSTDFDAADEEFVKCGLALHIDISEYQENREKEKAERKSREYFQNLQNAVYTMMSGGADAENCCNLIVKVWNNAIWEKSDSETDLYTKPDGYFVTDFNEALDNLFTDPDFTLKIDGIIENQKEVNSLVGQLHNPPEKYKAAYECLAKYYEAYKRFTDMAVNPTGSLTTFSEDFGSADDEFLSCYQAMEFYLQD